MKKSNIQIVPILVSIALILSIFIAVFSAYLFQTGFHNVDSARNLELVNAELSNYDIYFLDRNSEDELWASKEMYAVGQDQMRNAFLIMGMSVFLIGVLLNLRTKL